MNDRSATVEVHGPADLLRVSGSARWSGRAPVRARRCGGPRQLAVPDVRRRPRCAAPAQQHVGEPTGRRAGVQTPPARYHDAGKRVQRAGELEPPREAYLRRVGADAYRRVGIDAAGRLRACIPRTSTRPAAISSPPCARDRASPRRTNSTSRRCTRLGTSIGPVDGPRRYGSAAVDLGQRVLQLRVDTAEHVRVLGQRALGDAVEGRETADDPGRSRFE